MFSISTILYTLPATLIKQDDFNKIIENQDLVYLIVVLSRLKNKNFLNQENLNVIIEHQNFFCLVAILDMLDRLEFTPTQENINQIIKHAPHYLVSNLNTAVPTLKRLDLLTEESFTSLINHRELESLTGCLSKLAESNLLTQNNFDLLIKFQDCYTLNEALNKLKKSNLLTQDNFNSLINLTPSALYSLTFSLISLAESHLLKRDNFNFLIEHQDILTLPDTWIRIPHSLNEQYWSSIVTICTTENITLAEKQNNFRTYIDNNILPQIQRERQREQNNAFDYIQNTHTFSIHLGTDLTVWLLEQLYFKDQSPSFNEKDQWTDLERSIENNKENNDKTTVALRCMKRLKDYHIQLTVYPEKKANCLGLIECEETELKENQSIQQIGLDNLQRIQYHKSALTLYQFITALYDNAIENIDKTITPEQKEEQKKIIIAQFIDAFYEIQRGSNLDEDGKDVNPNGPDDTICFGGTANKFCEKLKGFAPAAQQFFINEASLQINLKACFIQNILSHGQTLLEESNTSELKALKKQFTQNDQNALSEYIETLIKNETFKNNFIRAATKKNSLFQILFPDGKEKLEKQIDTFLKNFAPYLGQIKFDEQDPYGAPITEKFEEKDKTQHTTKEQLKTLFDEIDKLDQKEDNSSPGSQGLFKPVLNHPQEEGDAQNHSFIH